jgi:hypothetical protein
MVRELGLPIFYVKDIDADMLEGSLERLIASARHERDRLLELKAATRGRYLHLLGNACGAC